MSLADCFGKPGLAPLFTPADVQEINRLAQEAGGELAGVDQYISTLTASREELRRQVLAAGFDVAPTVPPAQIPEVTPAAGAGTTLQSLAQSADVKAVTDRAIELMKRAKAGSEFAPEDQGTDLFQMDIVKEDPADAEGVAVSHGDIISGRNVGATVRIMHPTSRDVSLFGATTHDADNYQQWLSMIRRESEARRTGVIQFNFPVENKTAGIPIGQLSKGCGRASAILSLVRSGHLSAAEGHHLQSCYGDMCYSNEMGKEGLNPFTTVVRSARKEFKAGAAGDNVALMAGVIKKYIDPSFEESFILKIGTGKKAKEHPALTAAKKAFKELPFSQKAKLVRDLAAAGQDAKWVPQEGITPIVPSGKMVAAWWASSKGAAAARKIKANGSDHIRFNQTGDFTMDVMDGGAYAMLEALKGKELIGPAVGEKKAVFISDGWYADVPPQMFHDLFRDFGDVMVLHVSGPMMFTQWETELRLAGYKKMLDIGAEHGFLPVMRLVTDLSQQLGEKHNDPVAIEQTMQFIVDNNIPPRAILETPFHIDKAGIGNVINPTYENVLAVGERMSEVLQVTAPDGAALAPVIIAHNKEHGHTAATTTITPEYLEGLGVDMSLVATLRTRGYFTKVAGKERIFPDWCCATGNCGTCPTGCAVEGSKVAARAARAATGRRPNSSIVIVARALAPLAPSDASMMLDSINKKAKAETDLFQDGRTDISPLGFFSQARRNAENFKGDSASGKDWLTFFDNVGPKTELGTIVGLREMLETVEGPISKEQMLQFIDQNGLHLDEVVLTGEQQGDIRLRQVDDQELDPPFDQDVQARVESESEFLAGVVAQSLGIDPLNVTEDQIRAEAEAQVNVDQNAREPGEIERRITLQDQEGNNYFLTGSEEFGWRVDTEGLSILGELVLNETFNNIHDATIALEGALEGQSLGVRFARGNLVLPGGEQQREFYLTLPVGSTANDTIEDWLNPPGHQIGDPVADNRMVVRIRTNTRVVDGKRILFIEEIQGDRQQEARDQGGFRDPETVVSRETLGAAKEAASDVLAKADLLGFHTADAALDRVRLAGSQRWATEVYIEETTELTEEDVAVVDEYLKIKEQFRVEARVPPPIPWPTDSKWATLGMKRIVFKAVEEGFDAVAWTPAEVQIERNSLSRVVDHITTSGSGAGSFNRELEGGVIVGRDIDGRNVFTLRYDVKTGDIKKSEGNLDIRAKNIAQVVGPELTEKILAADNQQEFFGQDLDVGGKGMIRFYDEVMHDIANKIGKPFGKQKVEGIRIFAKEPGAGATTGELREAGLEAHPISIEDHTDADLGEFIVRNAVTGSSFNAADHTEADRIAERELTKILGPQQKVPSLPINDQMRELIPQQGFSFNQEPKGPLGAFSSQDPNAVQLKLFEGQDLSTLLHESGHMFVFMLERMSQLPGASQRLKDNYQAMLEWVGATNADDLNLQLNGEEARKKQEKLAEAFEAYLMEGKAPSAKLKNVFAQFAAWLKIIYTKFRQLGTQIDPEISRLFDRMLATDAEIEVMKVANEFDATEAPPSIKLLPPDQQAQWFLNQVEADELARNEAARVQREVDLRGEQEVWLTELAKVEAEVEEELWKRAPYRAFWYLTRGGFRNENTPAGMANRRLSKKDLLASGMTQEELSALPRAGRVIYTNNEEDATPADIIAPFLGFETGAELIEVLRTMIPAEQAIKNEANLIMESRHPSPLVDGRLQEITEQALYNEERRQVIKLELDGLALAAGAASVTREEIKAAVDEIIASQPVSELLRPAKFMNAAIRAAKAAAKAEAAGDAQKAFTEKRKQMLNHELLRRSLKAKKDIEKGIKYLKKFNRPKKVSAIQADYVDHILELTSAYQLGPALSAARRDRLDAAAFRKWIQQVEKDDGAVLIIPEEILIADEKTHYKDIPLTDFEALVDTVRSLERQGRLAKRNIRADEEMARKAIIKEIEVRMARLPQTGTAARQAARDPGFFDPLFSAFKTFDAAMIKTEFLLEFMDGGPAGPAQSSIFQPFVEAEFAENELTQDFGEKFAAALDKLSKESKKAMNKPVFNAALGMKVTRSQLLHMALNAGNLSNLTKMIEGSAKDVLEGAVPFTEESVSAALQQLTAEEIDFVNTVWSLFEGMKEAVGEVHRRETSRVPVWMDPLETELPNGTLTGGYIPMMYDPGRSGEAADIENKSALEMMQAEVTQASVFSGMTKERSEGFSAPVLLDISRLPAELQKTAHFITHYEAVRNANKLIGDRTFRGLVVNKFGEEYYQILKSWVGQVATGNRGKLRFDVVGDLVEHLRSNATVAIMGASVTTTLTQPLGLFTAVDTLARGVDGKVKPGRGAFRMVQGLLAMLNPGAVKAAYAASKELRFRRENSDRDIRTALKGLKGAKGKKAQTQRFLLIAIPTIQFYTVDVPTFIGAFNMASANGMGDKKAAEFADGVMRKTQGTGSAKDLSAMLATRGTSRAVTMFMTFFNTLYNIQRRLGREAEWSLDFTYKLVAGSVVLYVLPSIIEGLFRLEGPDPDDDEDSYLKWLAWKSALFAGSTIPVVRDFVSGIGTAYGYDPTPLSGAGESVVKVWQDAQKILDDEKELTPAVLRAIITMLGFTTGRVPSNQLNRAVKAWEKYQEEGAEDFNYWQFLVGPDKREK